MPEMQWHPLNLELAGSAEVRERKYLDDGQVGSRCSRDSVEVAYRADILVLSPLSLCHIIVLLAMQSRDGHHRAAVQRTFSVAMREENEREAGYQAGD
jgi:hypothetical protein